MKFSIRGVLAALFILTMAALCVRLGFWQLDRLEQRRARNDAVRAADARPPLVLDAATFAAVSADPSAYEWRRVNAAGRYDHRGDMVLRGRGSGGTPGVHVVSPLILRGGGVVMVNRGWAPSPDAATLRAAELRTPAGEVRVDGILQPITTQADRGMPAAGRAGGDTTYRRLDGAVLRERMGAPVLPLHLQQLPGGAAAGPPTPLPPPELGEGNHLSYAVQWFSFATIAVVGLAILAFRRKGR